jgi:hypothetical protein
VSDDDHDGMLTMNNEEGQNSMAGIWSADGVTVAHMDDLHVGASCLVGGE